MHQLSSETDCRFVSSRGILQSTDTHIAQPVSGFRKIPWEFAKRLNSKVGILYLTVEMLPRFTRWHLWRIRKPFTLVTGDSDLSVSETDIPTRCLKALLDNPFLIAWYAQNLDLSHPKLYPIPIGMDYHTIATSNSPSSPHDWGDHLTPSQQEALLRSIQIDAGPLISKTKQAFSNWHFTIDRGNRKECFSHFPKYRSFYQPEFLARDQSWRLNSTFAFTISPLGNGLDCHRTWEALLLGTIPIVKHSPIDALYQDLPVVILDEWSDFTEERMNSELERATTERFDFRRLDLSYWQQVIRGEEPKASPRMTFEQFRQTINLY